ncbi:hypothetical protein ACRYCC_42450 [Actinomadura scrupuli]|uniref:hypothetical protein n=1 Tax=Actinomadura scrupuli TaxID=559629 RepID=UPI003D95D0D5
MILALIAGPRKGGRPLRVKAFVDRDAMTGHALINDRSASERQLDRQWARSM